MDTDDRRREACSPGAPHRGRGPSCDGHVHGGDWLLVYGQLLGTKSGPLADLRKSITTIDPDARDEMVKTDEMLLAAQVQRFRGRTAFWESRQRRDA